MARIASIGFELDTITNGIEITGSFTASATVAISSVQANTGTYSMLFTNSAGGDSDVWLTLPASGQLYIRAYIYVTAYPSASVTLIEPEATSTSQAAGGIFMNSSGQIGLTTFTGAAGSNPIYGTTLSSAVSKNAWHYIELFTNASVANTQTVTVRLDGTQIDSETGSVTLAANVLNELDWGIALESAETASGTIYFDDIVVNNNSGSFQNTWAGPGHLLRYSPSAAGDSNTFATQTGGTAGSANNYTRVKEVTPDSATTFNGSNTSAQSDLYEVSAVGTSLPAGATINAVMVGVWYRASTASAESAFQVQIEQTSGGTISKSTAITPNSTTWKANANSAPLTYPLILYQDPTSTNWTTTTVASMQIGMIISTGNTNRADISTIWAYVDYTPASAESISISDSTSTSEAVTLLATDNRSVSDSTTTSEFINVSLTNNINVSDTTTTSESILPRFSYLTFKDEFDTIDSSVWTTTQAGGATVALANEAVTVTFPAACTASTDGDLTSIWQYDLTGAAASIKVMAVPSSLTAADAELRLEIDGTDYLRWVYESGTLYAQYEVAGSRTTLFSVTYSATTHLYWRIRESAGTTYWDTSADGTTWANQASIADPIVVNSLYAVIAGTCHQIEVNPGTFIFDDFNINLNTIVTSDTTTTSETIKLLVTDNVPISDSTVTAENIVLLASNQVSVNDTTVTSENVTVIVPVLPIAVSDSTTTAELVRTEADNFIRVSDLTTTSESVSAQESVTISVSDGTTTSEAIMVQDQEGIAVMDSTATSEGVTVQIPAASGLSISVTDTTSTSEAVTASGQTSISVSDLTTTSENIVLLSQELIRVSDTTTTSEVIKPEVNSPVSVSDTTVTSESVTVLIPNVPINVSDTTLTSESAQLNFLGIISVNDSTATSENVTIQIASVPTLSIAASDSTTTTESVTAFIPFLTVSVTDSTVTSEAADTTVAQQINVSDSIITSENVTVVAATSNSVQISVSDTISGSTQAQGARVIFIVDEGRFAIRLGGNAYLRL